MIHAATPQAVQDSLSPEKNAPVMSNIGKFGPHFKRSFISFLIIATALGGCSTQPEVQRDNADLRHRIHDTVPDTWRDAAASAEEISPLTVTPELREFIHSSVRSNDTAREKMLALTKAIIGRDGVGLLYDADATYTATEAFESGKGNCLGFSNLLIASARELGLNASFELVSQKMRWTKVEDVLVGSLHVRVISLTSTKKMVFDFYPLPVRSGFSTQALSDQEALSHHLNNLAVKYMQDGDDARAYALLSAAIEGNPSIAFIWSNLGILLSRNDLGSLAEAAFKEALLISPETQSALSNLQRLYYQQGRHTEARDIMNELEAHRARNPYYHFWLGEQDYEQGDYEKAVKHLKEAISLKKNESRFYILLSQSYEELGLSKAASRASKKAESIDEPQTPVSYKIRRSKAETGSHITRK